MAGLGVGPNGIRSKLFAGVSNAAGALGHITPVHQAVPLSITSRGVGFATCSFARELSNYRYKGFKMPTIYSLYRAFLGIFEAKMRQAKRNFPAINPLHDDCNDFHHSLDWIDVVNTATFVPEPFFSIISNVGVLKYGGDIYLPVMAKDQTSEEGRFIPSPETVTLSNLRKTVESLASDATPRDVRDAFFSKNPIPGCQMNGHLLANIDEIIPKDYGADDLLRDIASMTNVLHFVSKYLPKLVGGPVDYNSHGMPAMLLSNDARNLRCPERTGSCEDYAKECYLLGNIEEFWSTSTLNPSAVCSGVIGLLGETPSSLQSCFPLYLRRLSEANHRRYMINYKGVMEVLLFSTMKPDDPNKHNAEDENTPAEAPVQNGA